MFPTIALTPASGAITGAVPTSISGGFILMCYDDEGHLVNLALYSAFADNPHCEMLGCDWDMTMMRSESLDSIFIPYLPDGTYRLAVMPYGSVDSFTVTWHGGPVQHLGSRDNPWTLGTSIPEGAHRVEVSGGQTTVISWHDTKVARKSGVGADAWTLRVRGAGTRGQPGITWSFAGPVPGDAALDIHASNGRLVTSYPLTIARGTIVPGKSGRLPAGRYLVSMRGAGRIKTAAIVVLR